MKFKNAEGKNLILLKALPSEYTGDKEYKCPKGTVFQWDSKEECWALVNEHNSKESIEDTGDCIIFEEDYESNKSWYGLTDKPPTYGFIRIDGSPVTYSKGFIEVGCQKISNSIIRRIAKNLK